MLNIMNIINYILNNKLKIILYALGIFILCIFIFIVIFFFIAWISYICIKYLKLKLFGQLDNILEYNTSSRHVLTAFGDCRIKRIYLIRAPIDTIIDVAFNILSCYHWNKFKPPVTYHVFLLFEVEVSKGMTKYIVVEKINGIYIKSNYTIQSDYEFIPIKFNKRKAYTINSVLETTKQRIGLFNFYNWSVNSHCQIFTYNILKVIKSKTKFKQYFDMQWFSSSFMNVFHDFGVHLLNVCLTFTANVYKYNIVSPIL